MACKNEIKDTTVEAPEVLKGGRTYRAMFITAGPVGYKDGIYLLEQQNLDNFAWSLKECPVLVGHQDILDKEDLEKKQVGTVVAVDRCEVTGNWYADFVINDEKVIKKIEQGDLPYVSCAYNAELSTEPIKINNVEYKKQILGGTMVHLALVKNPRYNGTEIWKNSDEDYFVSEGVLFNEKDSIMFGFKKTKVELDKETLINTSLGDKTIEELVNELEAAQATIAEKDEKIKALEKDLEAEKEATAAAVAEKEATEAPKAVEGDDASLKQDLNNALEDEGKTIVVRVPNVTL